MSLQLLSKISSFLFSTDAKPKDIPGTLEVRDLLIITIIIIIGGTDDLSFILSITDGI